MRRVALPAREVLPVRQRDPSAGRRLRGREARREGRGQKLDDVSVTHDDIAFLQYTGGTTGVAKGAVLTHGNMVANLVQVAAWIARATTSL